MLATCNGSGVVACETCDGKAPTVCPASCGDGTRPCPGCENCAHMGTARPCADAAAAAGDVCEICGCSEDAPCIDELGPCAWVAPGLCSACE